MRAELTNREKLTALRVNHKILKKLVREFLGEIDSVPMRAVDCDQDRVDELWAKLARAVK